MFKKKGFWIILAVVILLGAGAYAFYNYKATSVQAQSTETPVQTATAFIGSLVISANGMGTVVPQKEASVGFYSAGTIAEILVNVGDKVEEGDVLARQGDTEELELAVTTAELELKTAKKTQQDLYDNLEADRADAQLAVYTAQIALDDAKEARAQLDYGRCDDDIVEDYYGKWVRARDHYDNIKDNKVAESVLQEAESNLEAAWANYSYCVTPRSDTEVGEADATVAVAQVTLLTAQNDLEKLSDGPDPDDVSQAEADVATAEYNLKIANKALEGATLVAPFGGTVMSIDANVGDTVSAAFITIDQLTPAKLEIYLDETDLNAIGVGYEVEVIFDALEDQTFIGHVTLVYPGLTSQGNSSVVSAEVTLDEDSYSKPQDLPTGLSASVEVIGSRAENVVLVPVEALRDLGDGQYAVFVMENGDPVMRQVEVGIMDYTYAEIVSGLQAGEVVTTGIVETN